MSAALVQHISGTSPFQWPTSLAGQTSVRFNLETSLCHGPELSSVVGAFTLRHQSSGMSFDPVNPVAPTSISQGQFTAGLKSRLINQAIRHPREHCCFKSVLYLLAYLLTYLLTYLLWSGAGAERARKLNERERSGT